jgi:uncharacterized membrane protein YdjX (TVP38/TMEM64 family)
VRRYGIPIVYMAIVIIMASAYFISPLSREAVWRTYPALKVLAVAHPFMTGLAFLVASGVLAFLAFPYMPIVYIATGFYMDGMLGSGAVLLGSAFGGLSAFRFYRKHVPLPDSPLSQGSSVKTWLALLGLRLSPLVPAPLVNFLAAAMVVSPLQYMTTNVLGSAPLVMFYVQVGQEGQHLISGGSAHWQQFSGYLTILILSTLLSAMGPWRRVLKNLSQAVELSKVRRHSLRSAARL